MMSKEAMKLALEALEKLVRFESDSWELGSCRVASQAIKTLREALAKPDFWEGYVPEPDKRQQALDKKAENARELGLDYEPVCNKDPQGCWNVRCQLGKKCKNTPAQRTWQGLTDEEIEQGCKESWVTEQAWQSAVWWAEAKLRSKNT